MNENLTFQENIWEELLDGKPVLMSPRPTTNHNQTSFNIALIFGQYLKGKCCSVFPNGEELYLTAKDRFMPDGMVVCQPDQIKHDGVYGAPDLVVEVLSSSTMKNDRGYKKIAYEKAGVREYWIVNPADKSVEQYLLSDGQFVLNDIYVIYPDFMVAKMNDEEKAKLVTEFRCSLFADLPIKLEDVFDRVK